MRNYRGKRIDTLEWIYGYHVITPKGEHRIYWQPFPEATSNTYHEVIPESVGQATGLKDKKGVMIYEGDVVKVTKQYTAIGVVEYEKQAAQYWIKWKETYHDIISREISRYCPLSADLGGDDLLMTCAEIDNKELLK